MPEIVDASERCDPDGELGGLPLAGAEVVQVEVGAAQGREEQVRVRTRRAAARAPRARSPAAARRGRCLRSWCTSAGRCGTRAGRTRRALPGRCRAARARSIRPGRRPVAAANITSAPLHSPSLEATAASCAHDSNGRFSVRRRCGLSTPCLAGLTSIIPQATARASTCRSAWVASKRCPAAIVIRQAAISCERSSPRRRSPNSATAFASSQRSFSIVSGCASCWARYSSTSAASVSVLPVPFARRRRSSARSSASAASRSD